MCARSGSGQSRQELRTHLGGGVEVDEEGRALGNQRCRQRNEGTDGGKAEK